MIQDIINSIKDTIFGSVTEWWAQWFGWIFEPIILWYAIGIGIFLVVCVIAVFLPFKWVRVGLGLFVAGVAAYIAGGRHMSQLTKKKLKDALDERDALKRQIREQKKAQGGSSGNWFGWVLLFFLLLPKDAKAQYEFTCDGLHQAVRVHGRNVVHRWAVDQGYSNAQIKGAVAKCTHRKRNSRVTHTVSRANGR